MESGSLLGQTSWGTQAEEESRWPRQACLFSFPSFSAASLSVSLADVPLESLRLRFALLQSLNTTLETFFLPLVELRQTEMYTNSIAALLQVAKGEGCAPAVCLAEP